MSRHALIFTVAAIALSAACGGRPGPATQNAGAFDPKGSDEKAIAIADQVLDAVGGAANWAKAKEIVWSQAIVVDGEVKDGVEHSWDRWNGRHQFTRFDNSGSMGKTSHDLYGDYAFGLIVDSEGRSMEVMKAETPKYATEAGRRFVVDSYVFLLPFKLKDPGVHLKFVDEATAKDTKHDVIKVTFDAGVGPASDTYYVLVDRTTHLPAVIEKVPAGKSDDARQGFKLAEWRDAGGLKFATQRWTLGYTQESGNKVKLRIPPAWKGKLTVPEILVPEKSELVYITNVAVNAEADDIRYVKPISPDRI